MTSGIAPTLETGRYGRTVVARLKPNEDVVGSLERLCREYGIARAVLRSAVGSLVDGCLCISDRLPPTRVPGPGVEIVGLFGEIDVAGGASSTAVRDAAGGSQLTAIISGIDSQVFAGQLVRGENLTFITVECVLQEWIAEARDR